MTLSAMVVRTVATGFEYLIQAGGEPRWAPTQSEAAAFPNMREAARTAARLPLAYRAYALPVRVD